MRFGSNPTTSTYACQSIGSNSNESCVVNSPQAGTWYIGIYAWSAYTATDQSGQICFIIGEPIQSKPAGANRDPIKFLIVHRKGMGSKNEVQTQIGYPYNTTDAKASASIDGQSYVMAARGSTAWLASSSDEPGFVTAFKAGNQLVVRGTSQRGTNTVDTYSLSGATAAMNAIDAACQ